MSQRMRILAAIGKKYVGKKVDSVKSLFKDKEEPKLRVDKDLPLGIRVNAGIELLGINSKFILNKDKLEMGKPVSNKGRIIAISISDLSEDEDKTLMQYRAFILPDGGKESDTFVLEIGVDTVENTKSCRVWTLNSTYTPSSAKEITEWLDGDEETKTFPYIGGPDTSTPWNKSYTRLWEPEEMIPIQETYDEKIISHPYGEGTNTVENIMCVYGRYLEEDNEDSPVEYLSITAIEDDGSLDVEFWLSIDINEADFKIS